jgi:hypothetical protein
MHQTTFMVPVFIVAYNMYMNSVDKMDQKRTMNPTKRKEQRLHMSLFTYFLDMAALQTYAEFQSIRPLESISFAEFKQSLCEELATQCQSLQKRPRNENKSRL